MSGAHTRAGGPSFERVATILRYGTVVSVTVIAAGLAWGIVAGSRGSTDRSVLELIGAGGPDAIIALGLLGLALVPIAALASAVATFAAAGERRAFRVAATVLGLVLASLAAAILIG